MKRFKSDWQNPQTLRRAAMDLLARREHSQYELTQRLVKKGWAKNLIQEVLSQLAQENLQNDQRFAESFVYHRCAQGYGPLRIRQELSERGVASPLIDLVLASSTMAWPELAYQAASKKFGEPPPQSLEQKAKLMRFLQYRGFAFEHMPKY